MPRKSKVNLPLIEVIGVSLLVHVAGLLLLGGITLFQAFQQPEPEFEAPPIQEPIDKQELKFQVSLQKSSKQSAPPTQKITVRNISTLNLPSMTPDMPTINTRVAIGAGHGGGAGIGRGFGDGGLDLSKSAVNFFGIKSSGERIMIIVDASRYMLEDEKGGLPAYQIIKNEVSSIVQNLSPGTLFNVMFYSDSNLEAFAQSMLPATPGNKDKLSQWIGKFNANMSSIANVSNNRDVQDKTVDPIKGLVRHWLKAFQVAQELNCDAMFILVSDWQWHGRFFTREEQEAYLQSVKWTPDDEMAWQKGVNDARAWLNQENAKRRSKGVPEKIVHSDYELISELKGEGVIDRKLRMKPSQAFSFEEIEDYTKKIGGKYAKEFGRNPTSTNIVLFLGEDEEDEEQGDIEQFKEIARSNRGRFRVLDGMKGLKNVSSTPSS